MQQVGKSQQYCGMSVMPALVRDAGMCRCIGDFRSLVHGNGIHVCPEEQRFPQPIYVDESGQVVTVEELGAEDQAIEPEVVEE